MVAIIFAAIFSYLLGSLSSAIIICRLLKLPDPRTTGSANPGATNVLRIGGKMPALLTLIGDMLKGFVAVLLAMILGVKGFWIGVAAFTVCLGHVFPIFFKFQGGKGVATAFGAIFLISPLVSFISLAIWIVMLMISRYVSLASITAAASAPVLAFFLIKTYYLLPMLLTAALLIWRHWGNIQKLKIGEENRFDFKKLI